MSGREIDADDSVTRAMMANPRFQRLTRTRATLGWTLSAIMWIVYFGFILMIAFDKGFLGTVVFGHVTSMGIVIGLGVLVLAFVLVAIYVSIANTRFDRMTRELRSEVGL